MSEKAKTAQQNPAVSFDFGAMLENVLTQQHRMMQAGAEAEAERFYRMIRGLDAAYRKAALDPELKMPSYLTAAMYALIAVLPETVAENKINAYAEAGIRRDQRARLEGGLQHDQDTQGNRLKAGT